MSTPSDKARNVRDDFDEVSALLYVKYLPQLVKKVKGKPDSQKSIMVNTFSTAMVILDRIRDVPYSELAMSAYAYCHDTQFLGYAKKYEEMLELAKQDPDRFVKDLHPFYNAITSKIRKPELLPLFHQFIGLFIRMRYTKTDGINMNVVLAYTDLIMQTMDYLRPNKFDLTKTVVGLTLEGEPISAPDPFKHYDLPAFEYSQLISTNSNMSNDELKVKCYQKYGFENIQTAEDIEIFLRSQRIFSMIRASLLPFINEYTYDIFPEEHTNGDATRLFGLRIKIDMNELVTKL